MPDFQNEKRISDNEHALSKHEAICSERYENLRVSMDLMRVEVKLLSEAMAQRKGAMAILTWISSMVQLLLAALMGGLVNHFWGSK